ncbi:MAG TPA: lysylphosphatidylglycerol synthase transmembrane domain-containing protein [Candidatus Latescibacteria bacterium]|nr:lysylphosphatidylglycerol synthase transmembrane domain-containing protein [Candidatus Latescibacterota bacterium]
MRRRVFLWIGAASSILFLYIALKNIAFDQFLGAFKSVDVLPVAAAFVILLLVYAVRTLRWRMIIESTKGISNWRTFSTLMIGFFANNVLPARAGELIRAVILRRQIGVTRSFALGTIVVERVMDVAALVGLLLLATYRVPPDRLPAITSEVRGFALGTLALVITGMCVLLWGKDRVVAVLERFFSKIMASHRAGILAGKFEQLAVGLEVMRDPRRLMLVAFLSFLSWVGMAIVFYFVFVGFHVDMTPAVAAFAVALVNLGMAVPSSPGYVGTYEFFMVVSLGAFGIGKATALAYGLVTRLLWYVFEVVVGFACLWKSELSIRELIHGEESVIRGDTG